MKAHPVAAPVRFSVDARRREVDNGGMSQFRTVPARLAPALAVALLLALAIAPAGRAEPPVPPKATPVVPAQSAGAKVTVASQIVKRVMMPGILSGTRPGFRYFFSIQNPGKVAFEGKVLIKVQRREGATNRSDIFAVSLPPGQSRSVYVDAFTGPEPFGGDYSITGFSYAVNDGPPSPQIALATQFEDMTAY